MYILWQVITVSISRRWIEERVTQEAGDTIHVAAGGQGHGTSVWILEGHWASLLPLKLVQTNYFRFLVSITETVLQIPAVGVDPVQGVLTIDT